MSAELKAAGYKKASRFLDVLVRWPLIVAVWLYVAWWLWNLAWFWAALWLLPGFLITMNVVGIATLPIYAVPGVIFRPTTNQELVRALRAELDAQKSKSHE